MEDSPMGMEHELRLMGILPVDDEQEPTIERDYSFKMPELDENGEPPW